MATPKPGGSRQRRTGWGALGVMQAHTRRVMAQEKKGLGPATSVTPVPKKAKMPRRKHKKV